VVTRFSLQGRRRGSRERGKNRAAGDEEPVSVYGEGKREEQQWEKNRRSFRGKTLARGGATAAKKSTPWSLPTLQGGNVRIHSAKFSRAGGTKYFTRQTEVVANRKSRGSPWGTEEKRTVGKMHPTRAGFVPGAFTQGPGDLRLRGKGGIFEKNRTREGPAAEVQKRP